MFRVEFRFGCGNISMAKQIKISLNGFVVCSIIAGLSIYQGCGQLQLEHYCY